MGDIGTRIRQRRDELGLTLKQLSRRTGISESAISLIEHNERQPMFDTAMRLARGLDMTAEQLENGTAASATTAEASAVAT